MEKKYTLKEKIINGALITCLLGCSYGVYRMCKEVSQMEKGMKKQGDQIEDIAEFLIKYDKILRKSSKKDYQR